MTAPFRIVVTDHHSASNRGDAAIVEGLLNLLDTGPLDVQVSILTDHPESARAMHRVEALRQPFVGRISLKRAIAMLGLLVCARYPRWVSRWLPSDMAAAIDRVVDADVLISKGGGFLNDRYGVIDRAWIYLFAVRAGTPFILCGQSIGPVDSWINRRVLRVVLQRALAITVRDEQSREILLRDIRIDREDVLVFPDLAFALPEDGDAPFSAAVGTRNFGLSAAHSDQHFITCAIRRWSGGGRTAKGYYREFADGLDRIIRECETDVVFLSTCTGFGGYANDDRLAALDVVEMMNEKARTRIIDAELSPFELRDVYARATVHVGMRMHSNILAILAGTPVVMIGYEFKTSELARQLGIEDLATSVEMLSSNWLVDRVAKVLEDRTRYSSDLIAARERLKNQLLEFRAMLAREIERTRS